MSFPDTTSKDFLPKFPVGTPVFGVTSGIFGSAGAEYVVVSGNNIAKKPKEISFAEAAGAGTVCVTGYDAFFAATSHPTRQSLLQRRGSSCSVSPSEERNGLSVLIVGAAGGTGRVGVMYAKHVCKAATVVGICSGRNAESVIALGADRVVDYSKILEVVGAGEREIKPLAEWLPERFDLIYDCVSSAEDFNYKPLLMAYLKAPAGATTPVMTMTEDGGHKNLDLHEDLRMNEPSGDLDATVSTIDGSSRAPSPTEDRPHSCSPAELLPSIDNKNPAQPAYVAINSASKMDWLRLLAPKAVGGKARFPDNFDMFLANTTGDKLAKIAEWLREKKLWTNVDSEFEFSQEGLEKAFDRQMSRRAVGKVVVRVCEDP